MFQFAFVGIAAQQAGVDTLVATLTSGASINGGTVANGASSPYGESIVTISGGTPSYSGNWVRQSGSASITPSAPTNTTTSWQSNGTDEELTATYRYEATDSGSPAQTANSDLVTINVTHGTPP